MLSFLPNKRDGRSQVDVTTSLPFEVLTTAVLFGAGFMGTGQPYRGRPASIHFRVLSSEIRYLALL